MTKHKTDNNLRGIYKYFEIFIFILHNVFFLVLQGVLLYTFTSSWANKHCRLLILEFHFPAIAFQYLNDRPVGFEEDHLHIPLIEQG